MTRVRARATRCCWPPESWAGRRLSKPSSPTWARAALTFRVSSAPVTRRSRNPKATFSKTLRCGQSAYCWNTMPRLRFHGGTGSMGSSSTKIRPSSGVAKPASILSSVVLPQPDGPSSV